MPKRIFVRKEGVRLVTESQAWMAGAMLGGGLLDGIGNALGQYAQNKWWEKQFQGQWAHDKEMAAGQWAHDKYMQEQERKAQKQAMDMEAANNLANYRVGMGSDIATAERAGSKLPGVTTSESSTDPQHNTFRRNDPMRQPTSTRGRIPINSGFKTVGVHNNTRGALSPQVDSPFNRTGLGQPASTTSFQKPAPFGANHIDEQLHPSIGMSGGASITPTLILFHFFAFLFKITLQFFTF